MFTGMFCVSSVENLIQYYELFKKEKEEGLHDLKIATIFSYTANEYKESMGFIDKQDGGDDKYSRDKLEEFVEDYNKQFGTKYTSKDGQSYYKYYNNIAKRVKEREIDFLIIVNMFLTGFDSKPLNTLYVDKNLKYHGLIQAFSKTNRILNEKKSQGNIVSFRNLKKNTDDAVALFSDKNAKEDIFMESYEVYLNEFNDLVKKLKAITPTVESIKVLLQLKILLLMTLTLK